MTSWNDTGWAVLLAGVAFKCSAILALAWLVTMMMRGRSAASRHLVWTAAFSMLLVLPFLAASLPALRLPFDAARLVPGITFQTNATDPAVHPASAAGLSPASNAAGMTPANSRRTLSIPWIRVLLFLWVAGALIALTRTLLAWTSLRRLRRHAAASDAADVRSLAAPMGIRHPVEVLETSSGMPMAFGLMRPAVFLPVEAGEWSEERRRVVLLHELAHIRRGDPATHILARMALCLHWWNPLAWFGWRAFLTERESAADDLVLRSGERASHYAGHLLEIARSLQVSSNLRWAAVAMARQSQLEGRLVAILDSGRIRNGFGRAASVAAVMAALLIALPLASLRGQDASPKPVNIGGVSFRTNAQAGNSQQLEAAAQNAETQRDYDAARQLLDSSLKKRAEGDGEKSLAYGIGLIKIADLERKRNHSTEASTFYQKAVNVLGDRPEAAPALTYLGIDAAVNKDYTQAVELFQRAQLLDPTKASTSMMWMALVKKQQNKLDEAEGLFQAALVAENDATYQRATILDLYALLLRNQNREQEALTSEERARTIRKSLSASVTPVEGVYRIGGGVAPPKLLSKVEPKYTEEARFAKLQGTVVLSVVVGADGVAHSLRVVRGLGLGLEERALDAISEWTFRPGVKDDQPVPVMATIEVNFRLL